MTKIFKFIIFSASSYLFFNNITNSKKFLDSFNTHLRTLNTFNLFETLKNLTTNNLSESPSLRGFFYPFQHRLKTY